jgi:hypothetical protein
MSYPTARQCVHDVHGVRNFSVMAALWKTQIFSLGLRDGWLVASV